MKRTLLSDFRNWLTPKAINSVLLLIVLLFWPNKDIYSQKLPDWFLGLNGQPKSNWAVGYSERSYYEDTAAVRNAFINACTNFARNKKMLITGARSYWSTENGTYFMGSNICESFDTSRVLHYAKTMKIIDTVVTEKILMVLAGQEHTTEYVGNSFSELPKKPAWIEKLPDSEDFMFSMGFSPIYYYEHNSWLEAEREARKNLALTMLTRIKAVEKKEDSSGEQIKEEELSITLENIEVAGRWKDSSTGICYVLLRITINQ